MSTEELIALLDQKDAALRTIYREQSAILETLRKELYLHKDWGHEMTAASKTSRISRVKVALIPFNVDTSTWTG